MELKPAIEQFIRDRQGVCRVYESDFNNFMIEILKLVETMLDLGFYNNQQEIIQIMDPLITLLDGSLDFYEEEEEINQNKLIAVGVLGLMQPVHRTKEQNAVRYRRSLKNDTMMKIKHKIV